MVHAIRTRLFGTDMKYIAPNYPLEHLRKWHYILNCHPYWHQDYACLYGLEIDACLQFADAHKLTVLPCGNDRLDDFNDMVEIAGEAMLHTDAEASNLSRSTLIHMGYSLYNYNI